MMPGRKSLKVVFAWPVVLAIASLVGLFSALIGDDLWDGLSWVVLSAPVIVMTWYGFRRSR